MLGLLHKILGVNCFCFRTGHGRGCRILIIGFSIVVSSTSAQDLNQFQNGEVADAVKINDNFSALEQRINSLKSTYEFSVVANGITPRSLVRIDAAVFTSLCADTTGCKVRVCTSFIGEPKFESDYLPECLAPQSAAYDPTNGRWRAGTFVDGGQVFRASQDNNSSASDLLTFLNCSLSDGDSFNPILSVVTDNTDGFSVINSNTLADRVCSVEISD